MAELREIQFNTGNLESQGNEYGDAAYNLSVLLGELDGIMNEKVIPSISGEACTKIYEIYQLAKEKMDEYPEKIRGVGDTLLEAAKTGKAIDGSLVNDISLDLM